MMDIGGQFDMGALEDEDAQTDVQMDTTTPLHVPKSLKPVDRYQISIPCPKVFTAVMGAFKKIISTIDIRIDRNPDQMVMGFSNEKNLSIHIFCNTPVIIKDMHGDTSVVNRLDILSLHKFINNMDHVDMVSTGNSMYVTVQTNDIEIRSHFPVSTDIESMLVEYTKVKDRCVTGLYLDTSTIRRIVNILNNGQTKMNISIFKSCDTQQVFVRLQAVDYVQRVTDQNMYTKNVGSTSIIMVRSCATPDMPKFVIDIVSPKTSTFITHDVKKNDGSTIANFNRLQATGKLQRTYSRSFDMIVMNEILKGIDTSQAKKVYMFFYDGYVNITAEFATTPVKTNIQFVLSSCILKNGETVVDDMPEPVGMNDYVDKQPESEKLEMDTLILHQT